MSCDEKMYISKWLILSSFTQICLCWSNMKEDFEKKLFCLFVCFFEHTMDVNGNQNGLVTNIFQKHHLLCSAEDRK